MFLGWQEQSSNTPSWGCPGVQRGFGGAEGHISGFSRVSGAQQDLVVFGGVHQGAVG